LASRLGRGVGVVGPLVGVQNAAAGVDEDRARVGRGHVHHGCGVAALRAHAGHEERERGGVGSELRKRVGVRDSGRFRYHLEKLRGPFVEQADDGSYRLTYAGSEVVTAIVAGTYTADATGAYRNGEPIAVSDVSEPCDAAVDPTIWWEYDARDEYARACEAIVTRFGDMRRFGAAQVVLPTVAAGGLEGTITNRRANPWDTVAGVFVIRQAGGRVTDLEGNRWCHDSKGVVASNGALHDAVLAAANEIEDLD